MVLLLYAAAPVKLKNAVLLVFSLIFYAWGEKGLVFLFLVDIFAAFIAGLLIGRAETEGTKKLILFAETAVSLGLLFYFKYTDFTITTVNALTGAGLPLLKIALPIGISFYTFQLLSYVIDVYRGTVPPQKSFVKLAVYAAMFPQLIAGPIVRYEDIREDLTERHTNADDIAEGVRLFAKGLAKKVLLADVLAELCGLFRTAAEPSILWYWLYALSFTLQIYFDFSGYSDMAVGLGRFFGFRFKGNFDHPYASVSITEFWRRWHISLGSWFRDYVYIPLGGSRRGIRRQLINIFIVWMLTGLWHGAAWNFVLWGLLYAILLTIEKLGFLTWLEKHRAAGHIYVMFFVTIGFVLFNAGAVSQAAGDIAGLFAFGRLPLYTAESLYYFRSYGTVLLLAAVLSLPAAKMIRGRFKREERIETTACRGMGEVLQTAADVLLPAVLIVLSTAYLVDSTFHPFLYFRF